MKHLDSFFLSLTILIKRRNETLTFRSLPDGQSNRKDVERADRSDEEGLERNRIKRE